MDNAQQLQQGAQQGANGLGRGNFPQGGPGGAGMGGLLPGGPVTSIVIVALFVITLIVLAVAFYKLFQKAGLSGAIGLLMLVPVVNLGIALYLAFTEWPVLTELARLKLVAAFPTSPAAATAPTVVAPADEDGPAIPLTT
jgi:hypothetical protein